MIQPPLPPALPPQNLQLFVAPKKQTPKDSEFKRTEKQELDFAVERLISLENNLNDIFYLGNNYLKPQLQDGPKCGLVALSIASSINNNHVNVDCIFEKALSQGFTKQGEIFNANFLAALAESCCGFKARLIEGGLNFHLPCIIHSLLRKDLILIPYDADYNHSPCCKKGLKAHWAVVTGFIIFETGISNDLSKIIGNQSDAILINSSDHPWCNCPQEVKDTDLIFTEYQNKMLIEKRSEGTGKRTLGTIYVIGLQGKSRHLGLWPFHELAKSNDNLVCFPSDRVFEDYVVPEGGVEVGLKGKAVILRRQI